jgi:hypothetical protein
MLKPFGLAKVIHAEKVISASGMSVFNSLIQNSKSRLIIPRGLYDIVSSLLDIYPRIVDINSSSNITITPSTYAKTRTLIINTKGSVTVDWGKFPKLRYLKITSKSINIDLHKCKQLKGIIIHTTKQEKYLDICKLKNLKYIYTNLHLIQNTKLFKSTKLVSCITNNKVYKIENTCKGTFIHKTNNKLDIRSFNLIV